MSVSELRKQLGISVRQQCARDMEIVKLKEQLRDSKAKYDILERAFKKLNMENKTLEYRLAYTSPTVRFGTIDQDSRDSKDSIWWKMKGGCYPSTST